MSLVVNSDEKFWSLLKKENFDDVKIFDLKLEKNVTLETLVLKNCNTFFIKRLLVKTLILPVAKIISCEKCNIESIRAPHCIKMNCAGNPNLNLLSLPSAILLSCNDCNLISIECQKVVNINCDFNSRLEYLCVPEALFISCNFCDIKVLYAPKCLEIKYSSNLELELGDFNQDGNCCEYHYHH